MLRRLSGGVVALALLWATSVAAQNLPITAFYGHFEGSGIAEDTDSLYFDVTVRDLDVKIGPEGDGFYVEWTSVIRAGGDPANPDIRKKSTRASFSPTDRVGVFQVRDHGDVLGGDPLNWARINENTLSVNVFVIRDDGGYEVQSYDRTLDTNGMILEFTRIRDGDPVRKVEGRLVKVGN